MGVRTSGRAVPHASERFCAGQLKIITLNPLKTQTHAHGSKKIPKRTDRSGMKLISELNRWPDQHRPGFPTVAMLIEQTSHTTGLKSGAWIYGLCHQHKSIADVGARLSTSGPELLVEGALQAFGKLKKTCNIDIKSRNHEFISALPIELYPAWGVQIFERGWKQMRDVKNWSALVAVAREHHVNCIAARERIDFNTSARDCGLSMSSLLWDQAYEALDIIDPDGDWFPFGRPDWL
jgi:hypothetical protein